METTQNQTALNQAADHDKRKAARSSVIAAIFLTTFKIIVGLMTNSLGILAEAAHSSLDLVAAIVTLIAVRVSGKPADEIHQFGHGKVENLSALFETLLLLATSAWIIYESVQRIWFRHVEVDASIWAFLVMGISIAIDFTRSRILYRAARKHNSQALEADALHFSTDIWSSSVVILGLIGLRLKDIFPQLTFLNKADAIAALGVAVIVIFVSFELGVRTIQGLMDHAPKGLDTEIRKAVEAVPGVANCHLVRVRPNGPTIDVDLHISLAPELSFQEAHTLTDTVEATVQQFHPNAIVTVHAEPLESPTPESGD